MDGGERGSQLEVLVLPANRKDGDLSVEILGQAGHSARVLSEDQVCAAIAEAGVLVLSEEVLTRSMLERLRNTLDAQPRWSDLPILVITSGGSSSTQSNERLETIVKYLQNVTLLERPIRLATFLTIVRSALSSRQKQFELRFLLEDLERSKRAAEDASHAKSMFLANMSHEIRTPLTAIVGFATLMKNPKISIENRMRYVDVIARNGDQLASIINDVLDLSKVEAGKLEIELREIELRALLEEIASWLRPIVENKGLKFEFEVSGALPERISADNTRIRQILLNLVSNAVKFTSEGGIRIEIGVDTQANGSTSLRFDVTDTGIGMPPDVQDKLFRPFSQADSSMTRKFGGTGLGLALSRALANAMSGCLRLKESTVGQGSRFELIVPISIIGPAVVSAPPAKPAEDALRGLRVLLAEDSVDNGFLINRYLEDAGASVKIATTGRDAVDFATTEVFDVILMDIQMPVLDGLSATRELRARGYTGRIIALTAHAMREERDRSLEAGCDDHLTKPVDHDLLISRIARG